MLSTHSQIKKYRVLQKIGSGRFGEVYLGQHEKTGERVAIKCERPDSPGAEIDLRIVKHETTILNYLHGKYCQNIPSICWFGVWEQIPMLIMPYYEFSLYDLFTNSEPVSASIMHSRHAFRANKAFRPERILYSMVQIIQTIHTAGVVHRDLKPHNFMLKNYELILIDFGLATFYVDENWNHIPEKCDKTHLVGTLNYISYHVHGGSDYTRRDDLLSLAYVYLFLVGKLLWARPFFPEGFSSNSKLKETHIHHPKNQLIMRMKEPGNLLHAFDTPLLIQTYFEYVYGLAYSETPDYDGMLRTLAEKIST
jgi:serine/threonine protein kinase